MATNQQSQITPSPSQLDQWELQAKATTDPYLPHERAIRAGHFGVVHRKALCLAYAAGADQELSGCCEWLSTGPYGFSIATPWNALISTLRAARRPKPPSQAEAGLEELKVLRDNLKQWGLGFNSDTIQTALERLKELENLPNDN